MTRNHSRIRFIGYPIPTTPSNIVIIGTDDEPGAAAGTYLGHPDVAVDIQARIAILKHAVDAAKATLPPDEKPNDVINLFVAPEFYFHGVQGPYVYDGHTSPDPVDDILERLKEVFNAREYPNWTFVFGSAITTKVDDIKKVYTSNSATVRNSVVRNLSEQWLKSYGPLQEIVFDMLVNFIQNCHAYPNLEVRDRAMIVSNILLSTPAQALNTKSMTTEKYFAANGDFLLYDISGNPDVVTEQMIAYPFIDLSNGDLKRHAYDKYAIFRQNYGPANSPQYMDFGVEVCLDHDDFRLRRNIDNEPWPRPTDAVHVQIIPSCGMHIVGPSVVVDAYGFVFNCDGLYAFGSTQGQGQSGTIHGVPCVYANYIDPHNGMYAGHTQLARVQDPATGHDPNARSSTDASYGSLDASAVTVVPVTAWPGLGQYYAGGPGQIHIYGLTEPYGLYPQDCR